MSMAIQLRLAKLHLNKLHAQDWNNVLWKDDIKVKMLNHCVAVGQLTLTRLKYCGSDIKRAMH